MNKLTILIVAFQQRHPMFGCQLDGFHGRVNFVFMFLENLVKGWDMRRQITIHPNNREEYPSLKARGDSLLFDTDEFFLN